MVLRAVIAVDPGRVVGLDQPEAFFVEPRKRAAIPIDMIKHSKLESHAGYAAFFPCCIAAQTRAAVAGIGISVTS
jgi:hypothetical protein